MSCEYFETPLLPLGNLFPLQIPIHVKIYTSVFVDFIKKYYTHFKKKCYEETFGVMFVYTHKGMPLRLCFLVTFRKMCNLFCKIS